MTLLHSWLVTDFFWNWLFTCIKHLKIEKKMHIYCTLSVLKETILNALKLVEYNRLIHPTSELGTWEWAYHFKLFDNKIIYIKLSCNSGVRIGDLTCSYKMDELLSMTRKLYILIFGDPGLNIQVSLQDVTSLLH